MEEEKLTEKSRGLYETLPTPFDLSSLDQQYTQKIQLFIEQEKLRMLSNEALVKAGVTESMIEKLLEERKVADFSAESIKYCLGIVDPKEPVKRRNTV